MDEIKSDRNGKTKCCLWKGRLLQLLFLIMLLATSCCHTQPGRFEDKVRNNEINTLLTGLLDYYRQTHYSLPDDYAEFYSFLEDYKQNVPEEFSELEFFTGTDILKKFAPNKIESLFYKDSAFILVHDFSHPTGSIVKGSQFYRFEHYEKYLLDEPGFWEGFRTAAFNKAGRYLFRNQFDYGAIDSCIVAVQKEHGSLATDTGYVVANGKSVLDKILVQTERPVRAIVLYNARLHSLEVVSRIPSSDTPIPDECSKYLQKVKDALSTIQMDNPAPEYIIIPLVLYN